MLQKIAAEGWTPLDLMIHVMREHAAVGRWDGAARVAMDAAPYVHPKLAAIEHSADDSVRQVEPPIIHVHFTNPENDEEEIDQHGKKSRFLNPAVAPALVQSYVLAALRTFSNTAFETAGGFH